MKQIKLYLSLTVAMLLLSLNASAAGFVVDGIYYEIVSWSGIEHGCEVTSGINKEWQETGYGESYANTYSGDIDIPSTVVYNSIEYTVCGIGSHAFYDCSDLTSISIPNSVTGISEAAFYNCTSLTKVTLPSSVGYIGGWAFCGCSALTSIDIPYELKSVGSAAFMDCSSLTKIKLPSCVNYIGFSAFAGCSKLKGFSIPSDVTSIEQATFGGCHELTDILIPTNVTKIDDFAFKGCEGLTSINIPYSVTSIGEGIVSGCWGLTSLTVDSHNRYYDSHDNCNAIIKTSTNELIAGCPNTTIPNGVKSIGRYAFSYYYDWYLNPDRSFSITIPNSVTSIADYAFYESSGLKSITIGNSVTSIGEKAFYSCRGLTSITLPGSLTSIGEDAFDDCDGVRNIYCYAEEIPKTVGFSPFGDTKAWNNYIYYSTLYVPETSIDSYKAAYGWKEFYRIKAIEGYVPLVCATPVIDYVNGKIICTDKTKDAVCHYTYTVTPTSVSGSGTGSGSCVVGGKIEVKAYATAEGLKTSGTVSKTFDYKGVCGCDVNGDGKVTKEDADIIVNTFLGK